MKHHYNHYNIYISLNPSCFKTSLQITRVFLDFFTMFFFPAAYGFLVPKRLCCHFVAPRQTHLCCSASYAAAVPRGAPLRRRDEAVVWRRLATMINDIQGMIQGNDTV